MGSRYCPGTASGYQQQLALRRHADTQVDVKVDSTWSVGANFGLNAWDIDKAKNKKWRHLLVAPHVRKFMNFKESMHRYKVGYENGQPVYKDSLRLRRFNYLEGDLIYSHFNVGNTSMPFGLYSGAKNRRLQGDLLALGAKYGYGWILGRDWWIEAEAGIAVGYAWYSEYDCFRKYEKAFQLCLDRCDSTNRRNDVHRLQRKR